MRQEVVWLAGLLHDIGKFRQRAVWEQGRQSHEALGAEWASQDYYAQIFGSDLEVAIRLHHTRDLPSATLTDDACARLSKSQTDLPLLSVPLR